ncbi:MarR family winged helix-turn-helix transcriptional regulator [Paraliobacillus salinarum]|uniref:MarR family winged helix-turn-helix transcriptional regulator n=1 Tax=Paraliobacillus salinarum TaxID=1158996 RepID=UPI0015F66CDF|nr:MarR family transcriptional regulator [Paraliobacillus salinarum]
MSVRGEEMKDYAGTEVATLIRGINAGINQQMREIFKDGPLTPPQMMIAFMLAKKKRLKVSEISKKMSLANSTVSSILNRLENQGYIERVRSDQDKRVVYVQATACLRELHDQHHRVINDFLADLVSDVSEEELTLILNGLNTLNDLLKEKRKGE